MEAGLSFAVTRVRTCCTCNIAKDESEFWVARTRRDGLKPDCKTCAKETRQAWAVANPERAREHSRNNANTHRDARRIQKREWATNNRDVARATKRRNESTRRARKRGAFVEVIDSLVVLERDDGLCGICRQDVDPLNFHVDHIIPLAAGGVHAYHNVQPSHPSCNASKGASVAF